MMDRLRQSLPVIPIVSTVTVLLLGLVCFGGRITQAVRPLAPVNQPPVWYSSQSSDGQPAPALLPVTALLDCTHRLDPCEGATDASDPVSRWNETAVLEPPVVSPQSESQSACPTSVADQSTSTGESQKTLTVAPSAAEWPADTARIAASQPAATQTAQSPSSTPSIFTPGPEATPWATPFRPGQRSLQLEQTARQADYHTRRGFDLAGRKAYYSARSQFIQALRVVAQGLDTEHNCRVHGEALAAGLTALDEVDDFVPVGSQLEGDLDMNALILGHKTPVLKLADRGRITPLESIRQYMEYVTEQLSNAVAGEVAGSMALHGLAKLHWTLADRQSSSRPIDDTKSLALFQSAVQVCPENYLALNDLGVLLARAGRWTSARDVLLRSLSISQSQDSTVQMNLAAIYTRLGDLPRARQMHQQAVALASAQGKSATMRSTTPPPSVAWVSPEKFAESYAASVPQTPEPVRREASQPTPSEPVSQASRGFSWDWFLKTRK